MCCAALSCKSSIFYLPLAFAPPTYATLNHLSVGFGNEHSRVFCESLFYFQGKHEAQQHYVLIFVSALHMLSRVFLFPSVFLLLVPMHGLAVTHHFIPGSLRLPYLLSSAVSVYMPQIIFIIGFRSQHTRRYHHHQAYYCKGIIALAR